MDPATSTASPAARNLLERSAEIADLQNVMGLLSWDQNVAMPTSASEGRGRQLAALAAIVHERMREPAFADAVAALADERPVAGSDEAALLRLAQRSLHHATAVPADLVRATQLAAARAHSSWVDARERSDFASFAGPLAELVELRRSEADALGWEHHRYDALHDLYEPGSSKARLDAIFGPLRDRLQALVRRVLEHGPLHDDAVLRVPIEPSVQEAFVRTVASDMGYDFDRGRLDPTVHPFCQAVGPGDVRITTRYDRTFFPMALFGTVHEAGHGMYEQGFAEVDLGSPLGAPASLGVHESQSRLWENHVGRSRPFWEGRYAELRRAAPGAFGDVSLERFLAAVNRVAPTFIRVEADEVTYPLHVILRYELEVALLEGNLEPADLPEAWNAGMHALLGIEPPDDARGCLQDVHWSMGAFGYFPTYALGSMMSAQLWEAIRADRPALDDEIRSGEFAPLLAWLRTHVHEPGARFEPDELLRRATGAPLTPDAYLRHLTAKVDAVVGATTSA